MKKIVSPIRTIRLAFPLIAMMLTFGHCVANETIRVLCYNIHYGQGTDGIYDVERLAKVINQSRPDFVALQEVDVGVKRSGRVHQARRLSELTGMAVRFGPTQHYEGGLFGNAVLTRHEILDVLDLRHSWIAGLKTSIVHAMTICARPALGTACARCSLLPRDLAMGG